MMGLKALPCTAQVPIGRLSSPPISNSALIRAECLLGVHAPFAILFPLNFMQQFTKTLARPVQLRLRNAFRSSQHLRDLAMLVPLDIVQDKYCATARWRLRDAASELYSINGRLQHQVRSADFDARL